MTAYTNVGRHDSAASPSESFSGALLTAGTVALFAGALFCARFQPALSLPALPAERVQALADAMSLGPQRLALAGSLAFSGNWLLLAASIALVCRRGGQSDLETAGWSLIAVAAALPACLIPSQRRSSGRSRMDPIRRPSWRSSLCPVRNRPRSGAVCASDERLPDRRIY
jgi:hypothetical protein